MKNDLTTGTWQVNIWCPIIIILLCTSDATTWSWPSCREVGYNRHLLHLPRGMWIYSYWDGHDANDGNTCFLWWFSIEESEIQDVAAFKDVDWHGDTTDEFKLSPPCHWLQWSGNQHVCFSNMTTSSRRFAPYLPFDWAFCSASYWSCDWSPWTYVCNAQYCSPIFVKVPWMIYQQSFFFITLSSQLWNKTTLIWYWDSWNCCFTILDVKIIVNECMFK